MIKESRGIPPIYAKLKKRFNVRWDNGLIIANGDAIYSKFPITEDERVHEMVHIGQQARVGLNEWWEKYMNDTEFRFEQEKEAYVAQARYLFKVAGSHERDWKLDAMAHFMSSSMYGNLISKEDALQLLQRCRQ